METEEKVLLFDLQRALSILTSHTPIEDSRKILDLACQGWARYRYQMSERDPSVDNLELSVRSANVLQNEGIRTISQLRKLKMADFEKMRDVNSRKLAKDVKESLADWDAKEKGRKR